MRHHTIAPDRQLRLLLPGTDGGDRDEIWDSLPEEVRQDILTRLARLLGRWLEGRRSRS